MNPAASESDGPAGRPPAFHGGVRGPVAFVAAFSLWALVSNASFGWLVGSNLSIIAEALWDLPPGLVQFGLVVAVVR